MKTRNANEQSGAARFTIPDGWAQDGPKTRKTWRNVRYSADYVLRVKCVGTYDDWTWEARRTDGTVETRTGRASSRLSAMRKAELVAFRAAHPVGEGV